MQLAQQLYEGVELGNEGSVGLITYMRTDSTRISNDALDGRARLIFRRAVRQKLCSRKAKYVSLEKRRAGRARGDSPDIAGIHARSGCGVICGATCSSSIRLIWDRFVASQMVPAVYDQTAFEIPVREALFRATGQQIKFDGFMKVYIEGRDERAVTANGEDEDEDDGARIQTACCRICKRAMH